MFKKTRLLCSILFAVYVFVLVDFLFFADYYGRNFIGFHYDYFDTLKEYIKVKCNFTPFATISLYLKGYFRELVSFSSVMLNLLGNLTVFMPLSFFIPYFIKRLRKPFNFIVFMFLLIVLIEFVQLIMMTGVCDIDDFILNFFGSMISYFVIYFLYFKRKIKKGF